MKSFIKENLLIVAGIALPLLVVLFFALATILPNLYTDPPAHDLLLTRTQHNVATESPVKIVLSVQNGRLKASIAEASDFERKMVPRLFRYSHVTGNVKEVEIPLPDDLASLPVGTEIPIPELEGVHVSSALVAPDGYAFRVGGRGGGLMTDIFGGGRRDDPVMYRGGAMTRLDLPPSESRWYGRAAFLGWVTN